MPACTRIEGDTVINTAKPGRSLLDLAKYIEMHIDEWVGKEVIWDLTLFDFSGHQQIDFSAFLGKARQFAAERAGSKTALVVHSDDAFSKLQAFVLMVEGNLGIRLGLFKAIEDAQAWIAARA